ncbi:hypothetical protein U3516DRAFT_786753 [Neocallimastix sp. 'constans']
METKIKYDKNSTLINMGDGGGFMAFINIIFGYFLEGLYSILGKLSNLIIQSKGILASIINLSIKVYWLQSLASIINLSIKVYWLQSLASIINLSIKVYWLQSLASIINLSIKGILASIINMNIRGILASIINMNIRGILASIINMNIRVYWLQS